MDTPSERIEPQSDSRPRYDNGRESGLILCHALGLNPNEVLAIHVHWRAYEMPYAEVEMLINEHAIAEVIKLRPERTVPDDE